MMQANDKDKAEKVSVVLLNIAQTFFRYLNPVDHHEKIGQQFEKLSNAGVTEALLETLRVHCS